MEIIKCGPKVLKNVPNIIKHIDKHYGERSVDIYACLDPGKNMTFLVIGGTDGLYITPNGVNEFRVDNAKRLVSYTNRGYTAKFMFGNLSFNDQLNNEYTIDFGRLDEPDQEGYTGQVVFTQYNPKEDKFCQLAYPHMYCEENGIPRIYSYHTTSPSSVLIEKNYEKNKDKNKIVLGKDIQSYNRYSFHRGNIGYGLILANEHGLKNAILKGSYRLEKDDVIRRFTKTKIMIDEGYIDFWPFCDYYTVRDIEKLIIDNGFKIAVPEPIINVYNDRDLCLAEIRDILMKLLKHDLSDEYVMKLKLVPDKKKDN